MINYRVITHGVTRKTSGFHTRYIEEFIGLSHTRQQKKEKTKKLSEFHANYH